MYLIRELPEIQDKYFISYFLTFYHRMESLSPKNTVRLSNITVDVKVKPEFIGDSINKLKKKKKLKKAATNGHGKDRINVKMRLRISVLSSVD